MHDTAARLALYLTDATGSPLGRVKVRLPAAELRRLHDENKRMRTALQTIANIALMDSGHWAKTIEAEALAASRGHN
jgi:hypothetical protein